MATFDIKNTAGIAAALSKKVRATAERALLSAGMRLVAHIQNEIIPQTDPKPVDRGIYRAAWSARRVSADVVEVVNKAPHAPIVEFGARAANIKIGRAMIDALEGWVIRKGLAQREEARGVAWAIAQAMKRQGIFNGGKGLHVLSRALKAFPRFFREELAREMRK